AAAASAERASLRLRPLPEGARRPGTSPGTRASVDVHWQIETLPRYLPGATRRAEQARADGDRVVPRRELMAGVRGEPHGGGPRRGGHPLVELYGRAREHHHERGHEQRQPARSGEPGRLGVLLADYG